MKLLGKESFIQSQTVS